MDDKQFQFLLTVIKNLDKKIDDFKVDVNLCFEQVNEQFKQV